MSAPTVKEESPERSPWTLPALSPPGTEEESSAIHASPTSSSDDERGVKFPLHMPNSIVAHSRFTGDAYYDNFLRNYRPGSHFLGGTQVPGYHLTNGALDQYASEVFSHTELHNPVQGVHYPPAQMAQHTVMQNSPQMPPMHNAVTTVEHQECPHQKMIGELNKFTHSMTQIANTMNARMTKAEYERDIMRTALNQAAIDMAVPQTAPEFGNRHSHHRDANDRRFATPVTPTRQIGLDSQQQHGYSAPPKNKGNETAFGTKLAGAKRQKVERTKVRKGLTIKVPEKSPYAENMAGLLTPMSKTASAHAPSALSLPISDPSPLTPGRIGPSAPLSGRTTNSISGKRKTHDLEKMLPAANAVVPLLPLTDTEIIVYFFQSLARPIVSLRLYARNWGPAHIVDVLNAHRAISGGYLRNTASAKCTSAIRKGRERHGEAWADRLRPVLAEADDLQATDAMQLRPDEARRARDFLVRDLTVGLKMHPGEGVDGGVFTRCVKWCVQHEAGYTLKNVHELALALRSGAEPRILETPVEFRHARGKATGRKRETKKQRREESDDADADGEDGAAEIEEHDDDSEQEQADKPESACSE